MNMDYCRFMLELYKTGSVTQAASNLFTSPQNISRVKKKLETEFHTQLFERTGEGLVPTENGLIFISFCQDLLCEYNKTLENIHRAKYTSNVSGTVSLKLLPYIMQALPNDLWLKFKLQYPNIKLDLMEMEAQDGLESLMRTQDGLGLFLLDILKNDNQTFYTQPLAPVKLSLVVHEKHTLSKEETVSLNTIMDKQTPVMLYSLTDVQNCDLCQMLPLDKVSKLNFDVTSNCHFYNQSLCSSIYIGFMLSTKYTDAFAHKNHLQVLNLEGCETAFQVGFVCYKPFETLSECERLLVSFLKENFL